MQDLLIKHPGISKTFHRFVSSKCFGGWGLAMIDRLLTISLALEKL